ncbi:RRXRR domain-containing protein [Streptosporangium sp. NBC_01810]|nr:RRXRR domain-containing protein [Streptosporangium sp. NBC_01810]WSA26537.1 RRXRR domain-containing protein [Streptosporangium sp. NBC_01810]
MATLNTRRQTDSGVLPQPRILESTSADTPQGRDETGRGRRKATGVQPGRGETGQAAPSDRRHPKGAEASEGANREVHPAVFVLDVHSHPLDPCHPARARRLLAAGRAVVVRHTPFVIRLRDRTVADSVVQGVQVGIDPGSKHTGIAVFRTGHADRTGLYGIQLDHRGGQIRDRLTARAALRRGRRSRNLRYRAPPASTTARNHRGGWRRRCATASTPPCRGRPG